jgi:hypothetical protein
MTIKINAAISPVKKLLYKSGGSELSMIFLKNGTRSQFAKKIPDIIPQGKFFI